MQNSEKFLRAFKEYARENNSESQASLWDEMVEFIALCFAATTEYVTKKQADALAEKAQSFAASKTKGLHDLTAMLVDMYEGDPFQDVLGPAWMELGLGDKGKGQFFTPSSPACLAAAISIQEKPDYKTVADPACGAGAMLLAVAKRAQQLSGTEDYHEWCWRDHLEFYAKDVSRTCALMCYVQLAMAGACGEVCVGDTLADAAEEVFHLPFVSAKKWARTETERLMAVLKAAGAA